ncbi:MAG: MFS transporter [Clostridiales bacterium]|nr:MFS transporter [Clostridiales bacterium]
MGKEKRFTPKEWSWIMYDWANSVYATNIMAAIFPTIFVSVAGAAGDMWWGYATSVATFLVAILAPLLGAVADFKGMKKKLFTVFLLLGVVFTGLIAATDNWKIMLVCYVLSRIGFSGSNLFYDSFLTDVTTDERMDRVSSWGYAMGYIGGSTIPFVLSIAMLLLLGYSNPVAQKFAILISSVWWLLFSIPFLKNVDQVHYIERTEENSLRQTFRNIGRTAHDIFCRKGLFVFVLAYFFYIDGVGTVISISTAYGTVLGLGTVGMILALLVTQIVAVPCSILFSKLAQKITARKALMAAIVVYTFICLVGFFMGFSLEPKQDAYDAALAERFTAAADALTPADDADAYAKLVSGYQEAFLKDDAAAAMAQVTLPENAGDELRAAGERLSEIAAQFAAEEAEAIGAYKDARSFSTVLFWAMAFLVGTVQGGIQAVSRSYFGKLVPKHRSNEFFGFFDIFGKFASVIGPLLYSLMTGLTGHSSWGVLGLSVLFLSGLVVMIVGKKHLVALENGEG